jgi:class 3 adenylate cyclase/tetratricopeptide (TPR) repeat protein
VNRDPLRYARAYIASDRLRALAGGEEVPTRALGAVLFADISGFTPLTNKLVERFGQRRGADELTRHLNAVYSALITEVERFGGHVIGFSGDAITCWHPEPPASEPTLALAAQRAVAAAFAMHQTMIGLRAPESMPEFAALALKTAIAAGVTRRFLVGDPALGRIDVLAGAPVDRMAAAEQLAQKGEVVIDEAAATALGSAITISAWRQDGATGARYAVVGALQQRVAPQPPPSIEPTVSEATVREWMLPALYRRLQEGESRFLAELRPATALFLRFSGLDYEGDPEAGEKLDHYIRWVQGVVNRYEGALIQLTTGDKGSYLYAAFGAPVAHDDDSVRAVAAALELRTPPASCAFITSTQIGLSQGMMRTGAYGSATRRTYGVLGDETIFAARLMSKAPPGQIFASQAVAAAVAEQFDLDDQGLLPLKGWATPQPVYAITGPRSTPSHHWANRFQAPLVGRARELALLQRAQAQVLAGQGQLVRIEGAAGLGKSHLTATFLQQATGLQVVVAASQSTGQDIAYFAGQQMLRRLLQISPADGPEQQLERVQTVVAALNPDWLVRLPLLGDLLGLAIPDNPTTAAFEPRLRQEALIALVVDIVLAYARRQPLLLLFEDIHWMDETSQELLLALARVAASVPLLLLLVHRPPVREDERFLTTVAALPGQLHLSLTELTADGLAALIRHRLQGEVEPLALALIQAQTQGNPFFAEELVDTLRDRGGLVQEGSTWRLAPTLVATLRNADCLVERDGVWTLIDDAPLSAAELGIPNTVQGIVLARLDRLPETAKLTLKVASVIGSLFEEEVLIHAHPVPDAAILVPAQMALLLARDFARLETPLPRLSYTFKHNITQEVIYQTLLADQRQELHLQVAEVLETRYSDRIEDLAFHYVRADLSRRPVRAKALHYLDAAGQRAKREYANETALNYFNRALGLEMRWPWLKAKVEILHILGRRAEEQATLELLQAAPNAPPFDAALLWGEYYESISEYEAAQRAIGQALSEARRRQDREGEARALARLGLVAWSQGDYESAERAYAEGLAALGEEERFRDEEAELRRGLGLVFRQQGKYDEAEAQFQRVLALNQLLGNRPGEARALNMLGHVEFQRRNVDSALGYYRRAQQLYEAVGHQAGVGSCLFSLGQGVRAIGDFATAETLLRKALYIHERINDRWWQLSTWNEIGILYLVVGDYMAAQECLLRGLELSRTIGDESGEAYLLCNLGQVHRELGDYAKAEAELQSALALAQAQADAQLEAICFSDLALVSLQVGNYRAAIQQAETSLAKFRLLGLDRSTTADLGTLAAAHLACGEPERARAYAQEALALLDSCAGDGPDYPQRDYWVCHQIFQALGEDRLARHALQAAHRLLMASADKIADPPMRQSFLYNIAHNWAILNAVTPPIPA